jgi:cobalt/nickel transport protein
MTAPRDPGSNSPPRRISTLAFTLAALVAALLVASAVSIWASPNPDGLMVVAESTGFLRSETDSATAGSPLAHYALLGVADPRMSLAVAGAIGCAVTFGLAWLVGRLARQRPDGD